MLLFAMLSIDSEPNVEIIPQDTRIMYSICINSVWYILVHTGDFYYYFTLEEPYRSVEGFNISISLWLLANGLFGIQTVIFYIIYQWHHILTDVVIPHIKCSTILFYIFGFVWTITGWSCLYHIKIGYNLRDEIFEYYMLFRLCLQTFIYILGYCLIFPHH